MQIKCPKCKRLFTVSKTSGNVKCSYCRTDINIVAKTKNSRNNDTSILDDIATAIVVEEVFDSVFDSTSNDSSSSYDSGGGDFGGGGSSGDW